MTLCIVIRTREGVVGLSDSAIVAGNSMTAKSKLAVHLLPHGSCFTLTSGLRSITDKVLNYARAMLPSSGSEHLFQVANDFGQLLRRARDEDFVELQRSRLEFDAHFLLVGRCIRDRSTTAFLIYPQGNWVEMGIDQRFLAIGRSSSALPLLNTLISVDLPLAHACNLGILAIDGAASSSTNVRYPIDIAVLADDALEVAHRRLTEYDVAPLLAYWRNSLRLSLDSAPVLEASPLQKP